jgi:DNA-binding transcriptional regulator GbsR (MarR family)
MKAGNILELYRAVAPVVGHRSSAWMMLLMICEAETTGLSRSELAQLFKARRINASRTLKKWQDTGLVEAVCAPRVHKSGRQRVNFVATKKLFKLLRVEQAVAA